MRKDKYIPTIYRENIFKIDYDELYKKGIRLLLFDLDNTVIIVKDGQVPMEVINLFKQLKTKFKVIIVSNNIGKRVKKVAKVLDVEFISFAIKPLTWRLRGKINKYQYSSDQICIIGDQLISDISLGNKLKFSTILVDPLSNKDLKITAVNRYLEKVIFKNINKKNNKFKRGNYYG